MKILYILEAAIQFAFLLLSNLIVDFLGLFMVAIAIPFAEVQHSRSDGRPIVNLPRWAWLWGNDYDGLLGDKRGWWASHTPFGCRVDSFLSMYVWAALRNPSNNMRFTTLWSAPIGNIEYYGAFDVNDYPGFSGWQFVINTFAGKRFYGLYIVHAWSRNHSFILRFGYKISPKFAALPTEAKGFTTKINLFKRTA